MPYSQLKPSYDRDGFVIVRQLLDVTELDELRDQLVRYIRDVVPTLPDTAAFYEDKSRPESLKQMQHMQGDAFFRDYVRHPKWVALAEALVGEPAACDSPEWFNKPPASRPSSNSIGQPHVAPTPGGSSSAPPPAVTPPHQDNYYFCLAPPNVVTVWLALDPVDDENGCLRYVAGSHTRGYRPHARSRILGFSQGITDYGPGDVAREVPIHLQPGDAVAHHGMTIHRAEANRSATRQRRSFAMVFKDISCRRDDTAFARYQTAVKEQHTELGLQTD